MYYIAQKGGEKVKNVTKNQKNNTDKNLFSKEIINWLKSVKISCKRSTYSNYEYTIYAYLIPKFGSYKTNQINKNVINEFTESLLNKGLSTKTIKDILIILNQILKYANISIEITMPKVKKKEIKILEKNDQLKLEQRLYNDIDEYNFGLYLCLYTGLRIGELCGLTWNDIDLEKNIIKVKKTVIRVKNYDKNIKSKTIVILDEPKSTASIRNIPIPNFIIPILQQFKQSDEIFFLTSKTTFIEPRTYTNHYKKIMKSINIDKYNFHTLRHTFATNCIQNGCDPKTLSEILGHSNVKITLDRYVHPSFDNKIKMMNNLTPMYKKIDN